ncbi:hypothetical protein H4219_002707 [Mycoemilia scoparia]|uniref:Uncharacterized protein n=1 Tax=Mycoemilia scoparia TaxID=417184 RepID=A0A9W8A2I4_9FUNG|nr:hypothetical protein H4219_002707 [Mycoemilia scoparia]
MSMFSNFEKELKAADSCLHKAADMFFHPCKDDKFHSWSTKHPAFPGTKPAAPPPAPAPAPAPSCGGGKKDKGCSGGCHCCCCCCCKGGCKCKCNQAPPPAPPPAPPKKPTSWRIYPCYKKLEKCAVVDTEWTPVMKPYVADKVWLLHVYLPGVGKDKVFVDNIEGVIVVHGEGKFHSHCGSWPQHIEHTCSCTRVETLPFKKGHKLPPKAKIEDATCEFENEVLVVRVPRGNDGSTADTTDIDAARKSEKPPLYTQGGRDGQQQEKPQQQESHNLPCTMEANSKDTCAGPNGEDDGKSSHGHSQADDFGDWVSAPVSAKTVDAVPPIPPIRRSSSSSSKLHDAIQDIIKQFDPLNPNSTKGAATTAPNSVNIQEMKAKFQPENEGFNYNTFLSQLRQPFAKPIARIVKNFLTEFSRKSMTLNEEIAFINDFFSFIGDKMRENSVWKNLPDDEFDNALEGMEKLVMNRLFPVCFSPHITDDSEKDRILREKMSLFRWIREEHLDILPHKKNNAFFSYARSELLKINNFKAPRDKLICILNCCTVIFGLLKSIDAEVGADKFLPILIYVVITANPPKLVSNVNYISRFRSPSKLNAEAGYYFTNMMGCIAFIESMDASCLSIDKQEFDRNIEITLWEIETEKHGKDKTPELSRNPKAAHTRASESPKPVSTTSSQTDQGYWVLGKGSELAQKTLQKTNDFVERLFNEGPNLSLNSMAGGGVQQPIHASGYTGTNVNTGITDDSTPPPPPPRVASLNRDPGQVVPSQAITQDVPVSEGTQEWQSALSLLTDMFPNIEPGVCEVVLQANNGLVSRTIEQLLEIATSSMDVHDTSISDDNGKSIASDQSSSQERGGIEDSPDIGHTYKGKSQDTLSAQEYAKLFGEKDPLKTSEKTDTTKPKALIQSTSKRMPKRWADDSSDDDSEYSDDGSIQNQSGSQVYSSYTQSHHSNLVSTSLEHPTDFPDISQDEALARKLQEEENKKNQHEQ